MFPVIVIVHGLEGFEAMGTMFRGIAEKAFHRGFHVGAHEPAGIAAGTEALTPTLYKTPA